MNDNSNRTNVTKVNSNNGISDNTLNFAYAVRDIFSFARDIVISWIDYLKYSKNIKKENQNNKIVIELDKKDIDFVLSSNIVATISQEINDIDDEIIINKISSKAAKKGYVKILSKEDEQTNEINGLFSKIKDEYKETDLFFGCEIDNNLKTNYKILAVFSE